MDNNFTFKEIDLEGKETLEAIAGAPRFNEWMYEVTSKHLSGNILEIGSGIGNISAQYFSHDRRLMLSDIRDNYCEYLVQKFGDSPYCAGVRNIDLVHPDFEREYADLIGTFDGVFALNVVEHIENDVLAVANCKKLLRVGGRLVVLVPAYQWLYNGFDEALEHFRRYTVKSLLSVFGQNDFNILHSQYFNLAAIAGWWFSGNVLQKKTIPSGQMKVYNALVPVFRIADAVVLHRMGISAIVVGEKR